MTLTELRALANAARPDGEKNKHSEMADYLKKVYQFRTEEGGHLKVFTQGYYHSISERDEHHFNRALSWKGFKVEKEDFFQILKQIQTL